MRGGKCEHDRGLIDVTTVVGRRYLEIHRRAEASAGPVQQNCTSSLRRGLVRVLRTSCR